jgi:competence protein ComEC
VSRIEHELFQDLLVAEEMLSDKHPLFLPLAALSTGVVLAESAIMKVSWWPVIFAFALMFFSGFLKNRMLFLAASAVFWLLLGTCYTDLQLEMQQENATVRHYISATPVIVEGVIASRPAAFPEGMRMEIEAEKLVINDLAVPVSGKVQLSVNKGHTGFLRGDRVRFKSVLSRPVKLGLPGEFDYPAYMRRKGIFALARIKSSDQLILIRSKAVPSIQRSLDNLALKSTEHIHRSINDPASAAVVSSLLVGGQQEIPSDLLAAYSRAGVSHILSISGFHVAVVAFAAAQFLILVMIRFERIALRWQVRQAALFATVPLMVAYLFFTGAAPATARSVLMLGSIVVAMLVERETSPVDGLMFAAFVLILLDPLVLFDLSFQLSFLSLWGVVLFVPLIISWLPELKHRYLQQLANFLAASVAASISTAIPVLIVFHQASWSGVIANILIVPLLGYGAVVTGALGLVLLPVLPAFSGVLFWFDGLLVRFSNAFIIWVAKLPVMQSFALFPHDLLTLVFLLVVLTFISGRRIKCAVLLLVLLTEVAVHANIGRNGGRLEVTFLSVGQGDSTLISFPDGKKMLVDGGGYLFDNGRDFGSRYMLPALSSMGIRRIDYLVLTHPHPDHMGGLPAVVEHFEIGQFWYNGCADNAAMQALISALHRRRVPVFKVGAGYSESRADGSKVEIYSPAKISAGCGGGETDANDDSLVLGIGYHSFRLLLMGDAGTEVENRLERTTRPHATVLKVGHHGSRTSSSDTFLKMVRPEAAVVSVGAGNRFGLPAEETLERISSSGATIYRTDQDGTVTISSNGYDLKLVRFNSNSGGKLFDMVPNSGLHFQFPL